ncbi:MAG TPA: serine hydrolase domain-containing protein [Puia sp.]|nr:serine hydrolase domain-containing protein [Puia sp.]
MFLLKTICSYLLVLSFLVCCGQRPKPAIVYKQTDSTKLFASPTQPLSDQELRHYAGATKHFFDSLFMRGFNGSILVAKNGEVIYEKYCGYKEPRKKADSINEHTPFHLASVTKTFTAMGILKLWEEGKLDIHDEVSKYLAGFPYPGVTIKNLLSQRSGLLNYVHFMDQSGWDKRKFLTNADLLVYINSHKALVQRALPGRHFEYSNTNYALLALVIEKASGQTYPEFMAKNFFLPLKMEDTYVFNLSDTEKAMKSFKRYGRAYPLEYLDAVYGDKNIYSTTHDLLKWDLALRSGLLFKKSTLDSAYSPYSFEKPGKRNYGLGWRMLLEPNGKKLIYHNGWWHGNRTVFIRMLDEDATIIALCNNDNTKVYASKKLCDLFGNYLQGQEKFEESESEPDSRGGDNSKK